MKKLAKVLLGAVALSALFVGCNNTYVANDFIDAPELTGYATNNGCVVLKWNDVKDVAEYNLYIKDANKEEFHKYTYYDSVANANSAKVTSPLTLPVYVKDATYEFKLVAVPNNQKINLLSSESTISITTPDGVEEGWKDEISLTGDAIKLNLVANTINNYDVIFPVDAGYKYNMKLVNTNADSAKALWYADNLDFTANNNYTWNNNGSWVWRSENYNGASYIAEKDVTSEEEDKLVPPVLGSFIVENNSNAYKYYVLVKAEPVNSQVATTKYFISTASASYDFAAATYTISGKTVSETVKGTTARVEFVVNKVNNAFPDASKFTIYRTVRENTAAAGATRVYVTSSLQKLGTASKGTSNYDSTQVVYFYKDAIKYDQTKAYTYTYYIAAENGDGTVAWTRVGEVTPTSDNAAWTDTINTVSTPSVSLLTSEGRNTDKAEISVTASAGSTVTLYVGEFATENDANLALAEDGFNSVTISQSGTTRTATWKQVTITNGVTTSYQDNATSDITYKTAAYTLAPAKITKYENLTGTVSEERTTNTTAPKYYVIKAVAKKTNCADAVRITKGYLVKQDGTNPNYAWREFN